MSSSSLALLPRLAILVSGLLLLLATGLHALAETRGEPIVTLSRWIWAIDEISAR